MLANAPPGFDHAGRLGADVQLPAASLHTLLDFITEELPRWRDRPERPREAAETPLTSQLCAHLNSAARLSGWDFVQFRTEEPDEEVRGRRIDLVAAPCGTAVWVGGRRHVDFDPLLPIECKRLPTPIDSDRDEREYVISRHGPRGGIQRFKAGLHGAHHKLGVMIGYVQEETAATWSLRVAEWINGLVKAHESGWTLQDQLQLEHDDNNVGVAVLHSSHTRENGLPEIELRHVWIQMN